MAFFLVLVPAKRFLNVSHIWSYTILQVSIVDEQIEEYLFCMLDEETDKEYVQKLEKKNLQLLAQFPSVSLLYYNYVIFIHLFSYLSCGVWISAA